MVIGLKHWKKTCKIRNKEFKNSKDKNVANFYESWKPYNYVQGYELISIDLDFLKLTNISLSIDLWNEFYDSVTKYSQINSRDSTALGLKAKLSSETLSESNNIFSY